ncbi:MAG: hypothetical protein GY798_07250, partial [Hyphomicrobiales bacterium]|nr:hypothetical protein [Hyphomicrobiales bacterium]
MTMRTCYTLACALLLLPATALSQEAADTTFRNWIATLDAAPDWSAHFSDLSYDAGRDTLTVDELIVSGEQYRTEIRLGSLALTGFALQPNGTVDVGSYTAGEINLTAGILRIEWTDVRVEDVSIPALNPVSFDPDKPLMSITKLFGEYLKASFVSAAAARMEIIDTFEGVETRQIFESVLNTGMADGRIDLMRVDSMVMTTPVEDQTVTITSGAIEARNTDLKAFVHVLDPDAYQDGRGDMVWRDLVGHASYRDITIDTPDAQVSIDLIEARDIRVRQPPQSFTRFLDASVVDPDMPESQMDDLALQMFPDLVGAWSVGGFRVSGIRVEAPDIDRFAVGDFTLRDLSIAGLRELSLAGVDVISEQSAFRLDSFSMGDMVFGSIDGLRRLIS